MSKMSLHFTAERSLGTGWSQASDQVWKRAPAIQSCEAKRMGRGRVLPQMTVTGCGSPALNATCFAFAAPAWLPCEISFVEPRLRRKLHVLEHESARSILRGLHCYRPIIPCSRDQAISIVRLLSWERVNDRGHSGVCC